MLSAWTMLLFSLFKLTGKDIICMSLPCEHFLIFSQFLLILSFPAGKLINQLDLLLFSMLLYFPIFALPNIVMSSTIMQNAFLCL